MALADTLIIRIGGFATDLSWTSATAQIVDAVARGNAYGVDDESIEAIATWYAWRAVRVELARKYDFTADKASYSRSQMWKAVTEEVALAKTEASKYLSSAVIGQLASTDPYIEAEADEEFG